MTKRKKKRRTGRQQPSPHVTEANRFPVGSAALGPKVPQWRFILASLGMSVLCIGMTLTLWIPVRSKLNDLRDHGVTATATVIGVDNKPKYVKVRFANGTLTGREVELGEYAGMLPDMHVGESLFVTYDPNDPSRSLAHRWVVDPPVNLPAWGTSALAVFFLTGAVAVIRRRRLLLTHSPPPEPA